MKKIYSILVCLVAIFLFNACHKDEHSNKTLILQPGAEGKDAVIFSCVPCSYNDNNYGNAVELDAIAWTNSTDESNARGLIYFDLSSISPTATIRSAKLSLYAYNSPANGAHSTLSGSNASLLQKVTSSWDESTVTWDTQPTVSDLNTVTLPASTSSTEDYLDIDVTLLVQDMVKTPAENFGLMLRLQDETPFRSLIFASSDNADVIKHPRLVVNYKH